MSSRSPSSSESFEHFAALQNSVRYLPISSLSDGCIYLVHARNSHLGIWDAAANCFVILREKFGQVSLAVEYHWDTGAPFGTAKPFVKISDAIAKEDRQTSLGTAHTQVSYERFKALTHAYCESDKVKTPAVLPHP